MRQNNMKEQILALIERDGPVMPIKISKELKTNTIIAGAYLSQLVGSKKLLVSHLKIGSSPLYFLPSQLPRLVEYSDRFKGAEKQAYELISTKKVLFDNNLEPKIRVALSFLKDFTKKIEIIYEGRRLYFWKWFLLTNEETRELIRKIIRPKIEQTKEKPTEVQTKVEPVKPEVQTKAETIEIKKESTKSLSDNISKLIQQLKNNDFEVIDYRQISKKGDFNINVKIKTKLFNIDAMVIFKKKKITKSDVNDAFIDGQKSVKPIIIICKDYSKKTKEEAKKLGIKIIKIEDL